MKRASRRWIVAALLLAFVLPSRAAEAVIPSAMGPIQALIVILPQILLALAAGFVALFKPRTYKFLAAYLWSHKAFSAGLFGIVGFLVWGPSLSGGKAAEEQSGAPWSAFRGGPGRTGAVAGARGYQGPPMILWKLAGDALGGSTVAVDSSPALVGNRIYFGAAYNLGSPFGSSGALVAVDTDTGGVAWRWTGKGDLTPPLRPVFSSPAVWAEPPEKGAASAARYVVSGEGYHEDRDCRIVCLDLEPVRKSKGKEPPKLAWSVQTTSHVESGPCIHEGKVYVGCGDDGVWCIELATGRVLWHIEGEPAFYEVTEGPQANALASLAGKTAVVTGTVKREEVGAKSKDDPGTLRIDVKTMREHFGPPVTSMESGATFERTVTGKVVRGAKGLRIEPDFFNPDSESPPVAVTLENKEQRVLFGSGIEGQRVNCVDALTGRVIWKAPTPYPAFGAPTISGDKVLIGVGNGTFIQSADRPAGSILCLSLRDGKELWKVQTADTILGAIAVLDGRAYGGCRDGNVYVVDVATGQIAQKLPTGAPVVGSPAVTADAIYVGNDGGKLFAFDRKTGQLRSTYPLTPGTPVICSPAVAGGKLFVGTRGKGIVALADRPEGEASKVAARPWMGPGGDTGRTGCADDAPLPQLQPYSEAMKVPARWPTPAALDRPIPGPVAACGKFVTASLEDKLVQVDATTGQIVWETPGRFVRLRLEPGTVYAWHEQGGCLAFDQTTGLKIERTPPPGDLVAHHLSFSIEGGGLACHSERMDALLWKAILDTPATQLPAISGNKVFVALKGEGQAKGHLQAHKLVDGALLWKQPLDAEAISHPVASGDWVAIATNDSRVAVFRASDGRMFEPLRVDGRFEPLWVEGRPVAPAICNGILIVAGVKRIAGYDLSLIPDLEAWVWNYEDQDHIGTATGQPVIVNETIWVGTTKRGLIAIGLPPAKK